MSSQFDAVPATALELFRISMGPLNLTPGPEFDAACFQVSLLPRLVLRWAFSDDFSGPFSAANTRWGTELVVEVRRIDNESVAQQERVT